MSTPRLCVTVTAPTTAELRLRRDSVRGADLVELRLDGVADVDVAGALADRRLPVIVTCRPEWEGGRFRGSEDERRQILADALRLGAEYVDIEHRAGFADLVRQDNGRRIVLSYHDFAGAPSDMVALLAAMRRSGAAVIKLAITPHHLSDTLPLLDLGRQFASGGALVLIAMGEFGIATRVLAGRFESEWTYAGSEQQVGQISASTLVHDYRFRTLNEGTALYGLVGMPVAHSVSPAMHNAAFAALDLNAVYLPLPAASVDDIVTFGTAMGVGGLSITIPYKVAMFDRVSAVSDVARRIGAINTIRIDNDRWIGENTDIAGFLAPLSARVPLNGLRAAVLGSGGAARAAAVGLSESGCRVRVHGRSPSSAHATAHVASAEIGPCPPERGSWDLLVNCTPVGMHPHVDDTPMAAEDLTGRYVYDLVYNPCETRLLREAARAGCQTIGGLDMLVAQAREQFFLWTGVRPPTDVLHAAARTRLREFNRDENDVV
jgi:3-dehydroquinate dehydratase/shikimate dehydrogenase